jgi:hypothetical protein
MNVYVVVEGEKTEKLVYASWIPKLNPNLSQVQRMEDAKSNNFLIEAGFGFPHLLDVTAAAMENIATYQPNGFSLYDRLVVVVDSEDNTLEEKHKEIGDFIDDMCVTKNWKIEYRIVVQHFCFEAWALGNRNLLRGNITNQILHQYVKDYNVSKRNPELLPPRSTEELNRAQFAFKYLKLLFNEKYPKLGYSKSNPGPVCHDNYFNQLKARREDVGHIASFGQLLTAFV